MGCKHIFFLAYTLGVFFMSPVGERSPPVAYVGRLYGGLLIGKYIRKSHNAGYLITPQRRLQETAGVVLAGLWGCDMVYVL